MTLRSHKKDGMMKNYELPEEKEFLDANGFRGDQRRIAHLLLAAVRVGTNPERIAETTGLPLDFVRDKCRVYRKAGVFHGRGVSAGWADPETGGIAFLCDVMVGEGLLERDYAHPQGQPPAARQGGK